jgi:hypothetical protein
MELINFDFDKAKAREQEPLNTRLSDKDRLEAWETAVKEDWPGRKETKV